ncbi:short-chain dehydrogenase [Streptomyces sp. AS58]|uniref:SDR family oxidoreductase n=1 Tax=Streptomyces sp. AS58 TaxID=1519489 RepID=UPI0006ADE5AA|nr:SDR family oxidoreductase [Streptomyces sp. AS58]KOV49872.1 short-chain dehydrogenase [Streptomyces sp. AS58]
MSELINDTTLAGRIAVVTGASSGIGEATARRLAARGAKVALLARRADRLQDLAGKIEKAGGTALALSVDVTDADAVGAAAERIRRDLGTVDLLVNNAGVMLPAPVEELRTDQWQRQIDLNITGLMNVFGAFLPQLVAAGTERGVADLVNVSSIAAKNIFPNFAVYSATKAYVTQLSRHLRAELGEKHVRVSAIEPGMTHSELHDHVTDRGVQEWTAGIHDIMLHSEDIAETIVFTVSLPPRANLQQVTIMPTGQPA